MKAKVYARTVETRVIEGRYFDLIKFSHKELCGYAESIGVKTGKTKYETALNLAQSGKATLLAQLGN